VAVLEVSERMSNPHLVEREGDSASRERQAGGRVLPSQARRYPRLFYEFATLVIDEPYFDQWYTKHILPRLNLESREAPSSSRAANFSGVTARQLLENADPSDLRANLRFVYGIIGSFLKLSFVPSHLTFERIFDDLEQFLTTRAQRALLNRQSQLKNLLSIRTSYFGANCFCARWNETSQANLEASKLPVVSEAEAAEKLGLSGAHGEVRGQFGGTRLRGLHRRVGHLRFSRYSLAGVRTLVNYHCRKTLLRIGQKRSLPKAKDGTYEMLIDDKIKLLSQRNIGANEAGNSRWVVGRIREGRPVFENVVSMHTFESFPVRFHYLKGEGQQGEDIVIAVEPSKLPAKQRR
jgi:hypothetical protein